MNSAAIATTCLRAWTSGDFAAARATFTDDVEFVGPIGTTRGPNAYIESAGAFAKRIDRVEIAHALADGDDAVLVFEFVLKDGRRIPTANHYVLRDGKIASVRAYFDPRPLLKDA